MTYFSSTKMIFLVMTLGAIFLIPSKTYGQLGGSAPVDSEGEVEMTIVIAGNEAEIDGYVEVDNYDYNEDIDYIGAAGEIDDGNTDVVDTPWDSEYDVAYAYPSTTTNVGDTYVLYGFAEACYFVDDGEGDYYDDCEQLDTLYQELPTGAPSISSINPNSGTVGDTNKQITVQGQNLVDAFGLFGVSISGSSGVTSSVQSVNPNGTQATISYSIPSNASTGAQSLTMANSFGTSNAKMFTVGYPPAVVNSLSPPQWQANTNFTLTISGTGFGTAPAVTVSGVAGVNASPAMNSSADGTQTHVAVSVAPNAPNGTATVKVQPGYTGNSYTCGNCNGGSGSGSNIAPVNEILPPPIINLLNGITNSPFAGQPVSLSVSAPNGFTISSQTWSFSNTNDVVAGYNASAANGCYVPVMPSAGSGVCPGSSFLTTQTNVGPFYFIVPRASETVTVNVVYNMADGSTASAPPATQTFSVQGPTGNLLPKAFVQTDDTATTVSSPTTGSATLAMTNAPANPTRGIWFNDLATLPAGNFIWVQILNSVTYSQLVSTGFVFTPLTPAANQLDGNYPYPMLSDVTSADSPSRPLFSGLGEVAESFDATMYVLWDPAIPATGQSLCTPATTDTSTTPYTAKPSTCSSIPIPLGSVEWNWSACAINGGAGAMPSWSRHCGPGLAHQATASGYPTWTSCSVSTFGSCK